MRLKPVSVDLAKSGVKARRGMEGKDPRLRPPDECTTLEAVRHEIDAIDRQIVEAMALRGLYVAQAAKYKANESAVRAPERIRKALAERRRWAGELGVSAELIDNVFRTVIDHFVAEELNHWKSGPR
jgi:isochorismate pyruvate lyase